MQIGPLPVVLGVDAGEVLQVLDDLAHPPYTFPGFAQQHGDILLDEGQFDPLAELLQASCQRLVADRGASLFIGFKYLQQTPDVLLQGGVVGGNVADGVIDLMGDAGGQVADRGKLLRLHQLAFQFLALADLFLQRLLGLADFPGDLLDGSLHPAHLQLEVSRHVPLGAEIAGHLADLLSLQRQAEEQQALFRSPRRQ
ncbi:Uncharacterised protein [Acinetobacter baumannii]|nr:Uncharacterised protein [Acinetobacter baumannii]